MLVTIISAGKAAVNNSITALQAARENAPKYDDLVNEGRTARAQEKAAAFRAESEVAMAGIRAEAQVRKAKIEADKDKSLAKSKKTVAKAGKIAAAGQLIGGNITEGRKAKEKEDFMRQYWEKQDARYAASESKLEDQIADLRTTIAGLSPKPSSSDSSTTETSSSATPSISSSAQSLQQIIFDGESYGGNYGAFNLGGKDGGHTAIGSKDDSLTSQTVQDVMNSGRFAQGAYQIIPSTMKGLMSGAYGDTGVKPTDKYDKNTQDKFFNALARNRVVPGDVDKTMAGLRNEWISLQNVSDDVLRPAVQSYMGGL